MWHALRYALRVMTTLLLAVLLGMVLRPLAGRLHVSAPGSKATDFGSDRHQDAPPLMDTEKCAALKARLIANPADPLVDYKTFFDGNGDLASIGCNLSPHPGIAAFEQTFDRLVARANVEAIYMSIYEIDPGDDAWPFSELVVVVGQIALDDLSAEVQPLEPDEFFAARESGLPDEVMARLGHVGWAIWWD